MPWRAEVILDARDLLEYVDWSPTGDTDWEDSTGLNLRVTDKEDLLYHTPDVLRPRVDRHTGVPLRCLVVSDLCLTSDPSPVPVPVHPFDRAPFPGPRDGPSRS